MTHIGGTFSDCCQLSGRDIIKLNKKVHCKYLNARFEFNAIVISVYSHYLFNQSAKTFDTKGKAFSIS